MTSKIKHFNTKLAGIFALFCILTLVGCSSSGLKTIDKKISQSFVKLDRKPYIPLSTVCNYYKLSWQWDGFSKIIVVEGPQIKIKLYPGSSLILKGEEVYDLNIPVKIHKGIVMVPETFLRLFFKEKKEVYIPRDKKPDFSIRKIVIDAGHGGKDPGAIGKGEIREKDIVLEFAHRLKKELENYGIKVILTRDKDIFYPLKERSDVANEEKADFFISVHANASTSSSVRGVELYYLSMDYDSFAEAVQMRENAVIKLEEKADYNYSDNLNATLWDMILSENRVESIEMANFIAEELTRALKLKTRFVKGAKFHVLKGAHMPAVLLEIGYITNTLEAERLCNDYYQQMLVEAITAGIVNYKKAFEQSEGFSK